MDKKIIRKTASVCPTCLSTIPAVLVDRGDEIWMEKSCPEHGDFSALVWEDTAENYLNWIGDDQRTPEEGADVLQKPAEKGCPHDCGLCSAHASQMTTVALMTSNVCNINCPVCFTKTSDQPRYYPTTDELKSQISRAAQLLQTEYPLELCGGEPTVRDDLDELITHANSVGFHHIQLNTNGLRLASEPGYAKKLKDIGVTVVYLGFEGVDEETYIKKYGRSLLQEKLTAIQNCYDAGLPMVFATIVLPGLNGEGLRGIVDLAIKYSPVVRGINFQPISYLGTYNIGDRVTIPSVIRSLSEHCDMNIEDFGPVRCQHPLCSFQGVFMVGRNGKLKSLGASQNPTSAKRAREYTANAWSESKLPVLTIGGMAFMDAWNFDVERVSRCRVGIIAPQQGIVPLCAQYLTGENGQKIYRGIC